MTGYGQASVDLGEARLNVELRSVNHRFTDLRLRLPQALAAAEREIRGRVLSRFRRGRLELNVDVVAPGGTPRPQLNRELLEAAMTAAAAIREEFPAAGAPEVGALLSVPGMFRSGPPDLRWSGAERAALDAALDEALDSLERDRDREGRHLQQELSARLAGMARLVEEVRERAATVPASVRDRLQARLRALAADVEIDPARVAQEALLLADRADVTEELVRLVGHLSQARSLVDRPDGEPVGKRLDFLAQEIGRETNTVSSKSGDLELSRGVLQLKAELEKLREQIQNVE
jgi:uncharacterized protein (TIGR00255 family)